MQTKLVLSILGLVITLLVSCQTESNKPQNANAAGATKTGNANSGNWNLSREAFEKQKGRLQREARKMGRKVGNGGEDLWLWAKTRGALAYADKLRDVTINVDVENAVVTLSGTLPSEAQKAEAEEIARSIEGVKSVKNDLVVSAQSNPG